MGYLAGLWDMTPQTVEIKRQQALQEIAEIQQQLERAKARIKALRSGEQNPRMRSRRMTPTKDMLREALQELDSYIFTLELKLRQKHDEIASLSKPQHR